VSLFGVGILGRLPDRKTRRAENRNQPNSIESDPFFKSAHPYPALFSSSSARHLYAPGSPILTGTSFRLSPASVGAAVPSSAGTLDKMEHFVDILKAPSPGVGFASGRLLRFALDRRAETCQDFVLPQAHCRQQPAVAIDGCAEVWMLVPRAMPKLSEDSQRPAVKRLGLSQPVDVRSSPARLLRPLATLGCSGPKLFSSMASARR
jgi:hypothetical protein